MPNELDEVGLNFNVVGWSLQLLIKMKIEIEDLVVERGGANWINASGHRLVRPMHLVIDQK